MKLSTAEWDEDATSEHCEHHECTDCGRSFSTFEFEFIDAEFDDNACRCPECQFNNDLSGHSCDFCDEPAVHALGSTFFCEDHFDDLSGHD